MQFKTTHSSHRKDQIFHSIGGVLIALCIICMNYVQAGEADVLGAEISANGNGSFRIDVTVRHDDKGWEHYANRWDVLDQDGNVLGSRVLAHPHDNEQPFTRSLTLNIPAGISVIVIRANDSVHGLGGATVVLTLPR